MSENLERILLMFSEEQFSQPVTAQVILELRVPLKILNADITAQGGSVLIEVSQKDVKNVIKAFKERGVIVTLQKQISVDDNKCIQCGACYSLCPVDAIALDADYTLYFDSEKCISCGLCLDACPTRAISI